MITHPLNTILIHLLRIKTLRRFCLVGRLDDIDWSHLSSISSKIEYFITPNTYCGARRLQSILQWAPCLKYLHIGLFDYGSYSPNDLELSSKRNSIPVSALRTLILSCKDRDLITVDMLVPYLSAMPVLNRLEIEANGELIDENAWRILLATSLPLLRHFTLRISLSQLKLTSIQHVQASFQNSFWISQKNFNVLIMSKPGSSHYFERSVQESCSYDDFDQPVSQCWIIPDRSVDESVITVDEMISSLYLHESDTPPNHYYFNNVTDLTIFMTEKPVIGWITAHNNCSQIKKLSAEFISENIEESISLLTSTPNKISLYINFKLLLACKDALAKENNCLKRLDISTEEHTFKEEDINIVARLFPRLEHLLIKTPDLHNIPLLKTYLPYIRSLTFDIKYDRSMNHFGGYEKQRDLYELRRESNLLYRYKEGSMTIWMDKAAYADPYWNRFSLNSEANLTSKKKTMKKKFFSFLNIFKK